MTTGFDIQGPTRTCAATGRELAAGDRFYAVLADVGGKLVRRDFAADAWAGPPAGAVAHWAGRVPAAAAKPRKPAVNDALLLDCFDHLAAAADPARVNFRYVVALLLMRRKRLKFEDAGRAADGRPVLVVRDVRTGGRVEVADPRLTAADAEAVQREVFQVLGWG